MSRGGKAYNIADVFADAGCPLVRGNTARVHGWAQVRDRLIGIDGDPLLLIAESCRYTRDYLPAIGRSPTNTEDAQEDGEATHSCDCVRYACMTRPLIKDDPALKPEKDPNLVIPPKSNTLPPSEILKRLERQGHARR